MNDQFRILDPETRAKSSLFPFGTLREQRGYANAGLKAATRLLDLFNLELDEALAKPTGGNRVCRKRFTRTTAS